MNRLIERYVHDVTRRLPEKQRHDVAQELMTEIHDMVDDRADGKKPTKRQVYDVLVELGSPSSLADRYRDRPRYVIGPDYYEPYISLLKTLFVIVLPILAFLFWMSEAMTTDRMPVLLFVDVVGVVLQASVHIFFWTTLSFWFVQKVADGQPHDYSWKPDDLPDLPPGQEISRTESYFAIAWCVLGLLATLYQVPSIHVTISPEDIPQFFAPEMWPGWTVGLLVMVALGLLVEMVKLVIGGWTKLTVTLIAIVNTVTIGFFVALYALVPDIANPALIDLIAHTLDNPGIVQAVDMSVAIFIGVIVAICAWEVIDAVMKYKKGGSK